MTKKRWVWYIHINSVVFLQGQGGAEIALCGPGMPRLMRAETLSVGLHQCVRWGIPCSPHKHIVNKWGGDRAMPEDQLHSCVNVVQSALVDLQSAIFNPVAHSSRHEGHTYPWLPAQSLTKIIFFNPPCKRRCVLSPNMLILIV